MDEKERARLVLWAEIEDLTKPLCAFEFVGHRPMIPCPIARDPQHPVDKCSSCQEQYRTEKEKANQETSFVGYSSNQATEQLLLIRRHSNCGGEIFFIFSRSKALPQFSQIGKAYCHECRKHLDLVTPDPEKFLPPRGKDITIMERIVTNIKNMGIDNITPCYSFHHDTEHNRYRANINLEVELAELKDKNQIIDFIASNYKELVDGLTFYLDQSWFEKVPLERRQEAIKKAEAKIKREVKLDNAIRPHIAITFKKKW